MRKKYRKCGTAAQCRSHLDITSLHGNDLTGKIQPYTDALNVVYFFFPVKAFEDHALPALRDPFSTIGDVNLHVELPALDGNLNIAVCRGVLHRIVQYIDVVQKK